MENRHEIKSIEDVLRVVNADNVDDFLKDFGAFLALHIFNKELHEAVGEKVPPQKPEFIWIDDGKHDVNIKLKIVPTNNHNE